MESGNFDWFLHTMLFYRSRYVLKKQQEKRVNVDNHDSDEVEDVEDEA